MPQPTVAISVDCLCAAKGKSYVPEIVSVAESQSIPLTWLLGVSEHDPVSNIKLYHNEYLHRIPAWHELGLYLQFDAGITNTVERGDLVRIGKDILKQFSIKPTAFRAANGDLEGSDLLALEDIGILVDSTPGSCGSRVASAPKSPYHPSYANPHQRGDAKIWVVPVANIEGARGYLDQSFNKVKQIIEAHLTESSVLSLAMCDCEDNAAVFAETVGYLKKLGARFVTLTQLAVEL